MQPPHCILQDEVANPHVSTHMATPDDNNHAAIPMRADHSFKKRIKLRAQEKPLAAEHRDGTNSRMKRPQPQPPHTGGTFHRRLQYTEKYKVSCTGFLPNTSPMQHSRSHGTPDDNNHTAITRVYCYVMSSLTPQSYTALHWVYWFSHHSLTPPFIECIDSHTTVSHHPSLSVLILTPQSHITLHWVYCCVMSSLTPQSHTTLHGMYCYVM